MSSWKKLHALDLNTRPLHMKQVFCHCTIKADIKSSHISILVPFRTTKDSFLPVTFTGLADLFPQVGSLHEHSSEQLCRYSIYWLWWSNVKIITSVAGGLGSNPVSQFYYFSCWHPSETRFKSGFHSSFWDFMCGIWKWGMASSFWNHVIQISFIQVHFQDIYSQLWIVKTFTEHIYLVWSNTYFWETVVYLQYGFLYLILIRP